MNKGIFWWIQTRYSRWNYPNSQFLFQSKVMMNKLLKNYRNCYGAEKEHSFRAIKYIDLKLSLHKLKTWSQNFTLLSFTLFEKSAVKESYSRDGPSRFIILNDSAGPKMVIKIYFNFFRFFLKVQAVWMSSSRPIMTANRKFVRFAHS